MNEILDDDFELNKIVSNKTSKVVLGARMFIILHIGLMLIFVLYNLIANASLLGGSEHNIERVFIYGLLASSVINIPILIYNSIRLSAEWKQIKDSKIKLIPLVLFLIYCIFQILSLFYKFILFLSYAEFGLAFIRITLLLISLIIVFRKELQYYRER